MTVKYRKVLSDALKGKIGLLATMQQRRPTPKVKESCEICGAKSVLLYTHHVRYSPIYTVTLCGSCHRFLHAYLTHQNWKRSYDPIYSIHSKARLKD